MTSDVAGARPLSSGSGKGQRLKATQGARPDRAWTSHQALTADTRVYRGNDVRFGALVDHFHVRILFITNRGKDACIESP
jgi:hypothetical protein